MILDCSKYVGPCKCGREHTLETKKVVVEHDALDKLVSEQLAERAEARKAKDFARADAIRDALGAAGIAIEDGPQGSAWSLK